MPETRTVKGFSEVLLPFAEGDFECCTFDHSDNSPYRLAMPTNNDDIIRASVGFVNLFFCCCEEWGIGKGMLWRDDRR